MEWTEVVSADDDMIESEILDWSGCTDLWEEHELSDDFTVINDVVEMCDSAFIDAEEWDGGAPGRSGTWYVVRTDNPDKLKGQIRSRIEELIEEQN